MNDFNGGKFGGGHSRREFLTRMAACGVIAASGPSTFGAEPDAASRYSDHLDLMYYLDARGQRRPVRLPGDWGLRRKDILKGMQAVMGELPRPAQKSPLEVRVLEEVRVGNVVRKKITYQSEPGSHVPAYLFLPPREGTKKLPAVLCLHQTTEQGKKEPAGIAGSPELQYAKELAERGFVTIAPDFPSLGEYAWDLDKHPEYASGTMKSIWDNIRAVDLLQSLPEVDGERIGCVGHSLGGHGTIFTGAFETRLKALVTCCGFARFGRDDVPSWNGKRYMPRIKTLYGNSAEKLPFDFPEVLGALAPRPLLVIAAKKDLDFDVRGVQETIAQVQPLYKLLRAEGKLEVLYPDVPHSFPQEMRVAAYEFLAKSL